MMNIFHQDLLLHFRASLSSLLPFFSAQQPSTAIIGVEPFSTLPTSFTVLSIEHHAYSEPGLTMVTSLAIASD